MNRSLNDATATSELLSVFDEKWGDLSTRLDIVPGKDILARLNTRLQKACRVTIAPNLIIEAMTLSDIAEEMKNMILALNQAGPLLWGAPIA